MFRRLFIKDYMNTDNPEVRKRYAMAAGVFGIVSNLFIGAMKLAAGFLTNSISITADAANSLSDCVSSCLTIIGFSLAGKKPDREHPYGHARYEYLFGFTIGLLMLVAGFAFLKSAISRVFNPEPVSINAFTYIVLSASVIVKGLQTRLYKSCGKAIDSNALKAGASDSVNDMAATAGILASMIVMDVFKLNIDGPLGLVVSVFVIINSIQTIREQISLLIGIKPTPERVKLISDKILSYQGILGIHDLVLHNYGVHNDFVTVHAEVDANRSFPETHEIIDKIETDFRDELGIFITIHMDPVITGNKKLDCIRSQVSEALKEFDAELSFHDMRMVESSSLTKVIFDCVAPPEKNYSSDMIAGFLKERVHCGGDLEFMVEIDISFC